MDSVLRSGDSVVTGKLIHNVPRVLSVPAGIYQVAESIPVCKVVGYYVKIDIGESKNGRNGAGVNSIQIPHRLSQRELKNENKIQSFKNWNRFPYIDNLTERKKVTLPVYLIKNEKMTYREFFDTRIDCVIGTEV